MDDSELDYGRTLGLTDADLDIETAKFTLHYEKTGERHRDWPAVFRLWLVRAVEFRQRDAQHRKGV